MDRGYPAWWLFALILSMNAYFCARISRKWNIVCSFLAWEEMQRIVCLPPPNTSVKTARQMGLSHSPLKMRLIRIDNEDKTQILITSLTDTGKYPYGLFSDLYHSRLPVEEDYKAIKSRMEQENFYGKSALSVYQDFHAKVLMKNLVSLFVLPVIDMLTSDTASELRYEHQVNFTHALAAGKNLIPMLFQISKRKMRSIIKALLLLLKRTTEPIRPGRKFRRKHL